MPDPSAAPMWSRRVLLLVLATIVVAGLGGVGGIGVWAYSILHRDGSPAGGQALSRTTAGAAGGGSTSGQAYRDELAARPMLTVPESASQPGSPSLTPGPNIVIPPAGKAGPLNVATGYSRTAQGAAGQLAAIDQAALQPMSIQTAHAVHDAWSAPGAPGADEWIVTAHVAAFLGSRAGRMLTDPGRAVVLTPVAAQIKGTDGQDWVIPCVLYEVTATAASTAQMAYGRCERMQWDELDSRWVIAPGAPPVLAPATWPGTDLAHQAGWASWTSARQQ
ncbi:MAG: hypothetical protein L0H26_10580 [Microlunatus sp.]|nr:hypothetical protein [Microlunatus sp.]